MWLLHSCNINVEKPHLSYTIDRSTMAPRTPQTLVRLNVYDLSEANQYMSYLGLGLYHTGVEIAGEEFSFASGAGVFSSAPQQAPGARFRESIELGTFPGSSSDARNLALSLRPDFDGASYNLFTKNCNSYSDALCRLLLNKPIPAYINRAAYFGSFLSCLVPDDLSGEAPVGDTSGGGGRPAAAYAPFAGSGMSLSEATTTSSSAGASGSTLADRREKVRLAALQRLQTQESS